MTPEVNSLGENLLCQKGEGGGVNWVILKSEIQVLQ